MKVCININLSFTSKVGYCSIRFMSSLISSSSEDSSDNYLGSYFAGLIEGDGAIIVPKTIRNQKGKLLYPVVKITFEVTEKRCSFSQQNYGGYRRRYNSIF